jgi:hypothetical protein
LAGFLNLSVEVNKKIWAPFMGVDYTRDFLFNPALSLGLMYAAGKGP